MLHVVLAIVMALPATTASTAQPTLVYRGCARLPDSVRGLSGITYAGDDTYFGVLEWDSKVVRLRIKLDESGQVASATVLGAIAITPKRSDLEGITLAGKDEVLISTEEPAIFAARVTDGKITRELEVPPIMRGMVKNYGFESLALSADGRTLWTANERALKIDGNPQTDVTPIAAVTRVRLLRYDRHGEEFKSAAQFEYQTSGVHDWGGTIGLCDLAALPDGRLLALERSAAANLQHVATIRTRIFLVDIAGATDISQPPFDAGLVDRQPRKVSKTLLYDGLVCDKDGENLEGLCLGPQLGPGRFAVLGVVDNTDGGLGLSKAAVVSFELRLPDPPASGEGK